MQRIEGIPSDSDSENSSLEDEEAAVAAGGADRRAQRPRINNTDALQEALEEIAWPEDLPWDEAQAVVADAPTAVQNVDDDLERELAFYNQALGAARVAIAKMEAAGVPWRRPADYYAEMVKTDDHMLKVREQLAHEQKQIEEAAQRRKQREAKNYGKQVAAEVRKERSASKKANVDVMIKLRKQRAKSGYEGELDVDAVLEGRSSGGAGRGRGRGAAPGGRGGAGAKREAKNSKYGFGGPKRAGKRNDAASAADMDGFRTSRAEGRGRGRGRGSSGGRGGGRGGGGGRGAGGPSPGGVRAGRAKKGGGKPNRPGKARRAAARG